MDNNKVCLTTFIYGDKYQDYIPLFVYSCHKAYPEYDIHLFLYDTLRKDIRKLIDFLDKNNVHIHEHYFRECTKMRPFIAQTLRWVLWDPVFLEYDYIYIADIDMFYIREPFPLHKQHIEHMSLTGLPFDNLVRVVKRSPWNYYALGSRVKRAGFKNIIEYLFGSKIDYKLTGLHFIDAKKYFRIIDYNAINKYKSMIINNTFANKIMSANDESFLYFMLKDAGFDLTKLGVMSDNIKMLDFNRYNEFEFRPHHGIHMGIFRIDKEPNSDTVLDSHIYKYYIDKFRTCVINDSMFNLLLENAPQNIKLTFKRMFYYYNL